MLEGKVKFYCAPKKFGYITVDEDGEPLDVFFFKGRRRLLTYEDGKPVWRRPPSGRKLVKGDTVVFELRHHPDTGQAQAEKWDFKDPEGTEERPRTSVRFFA